MISVKEVLIMLLVLSITFGAFKRLRYKYDKEMAFLAALERTGWEIHCSGDGLPWYLRPLNDLGIISAADWSYQGIEWSALPSSNPEKGDGNINNVLAKLASEKAPLSFVHYAFISDSKLNNDGLQSLCKLVPYCTDLYLGDCLPDAQRPLGG